MKDFDKRYLEFCIQFVDSIKEVYSTMLATELTHGAPDIHSTTKTKGDYTGIMGMNGIYTGVDESVNINFQGSFFISWPLSSYLKTSSAMLGEEYTEIVEDIEDLGLEICNITMGGAKKKLNPMGYKIEMSTPNSITGPDHEIKADKSSTTILVPLSGTIGSFYIGLNYRENE